MTASLTSKKSEFPLADRASRGDVPCQSLSSRVESMHVMHDSVCAPVPREVAASGGHANSLHDSHASANDQSEACLKILIAEDNETSADMLADLLEAVGYGKPTVCYHPYDVLSLATRGHPIDVFILDIGLPEMSGLELARRLRSNVIYQNSLLIAHTAYGSLLDWKRSMDVGFDHHLGKLTSVGFLLEILERQETLNLKGKKFQKKRSRLFSRLGTRR